MKPKLLSPLIDPDGNVIQRKKDPGWKAPPRDPNKIIVWGEGWIPKPYSGLYPLEKVRDKSTQVSVEDFLQADQMVGFW